MPEQDTRSEVFRRTRRFPSPPGRATIDDDRAVDVGWYDEHKVDGERVYLERFGRIPAPATLSDFIRTVQQIALESNGQIYGWAARAVVGDREHDVGAVVSLWRY